MADISAVEDKFFTIASETYENNLSSSISALDDVVPVNSANAYDDGDHVILTVDPGTPQEASFIGTKASSPSRFINCQWTEGNLGVGHVSGATIVDYDSATHHNLQTKGIRKFANDDGTLKQQPIRDALGLTDPAAAGWEVLPYTFQTTSGYNKGNKSFELTASGDLTNLLSPGMRFKVSRSTPAPTQSPDFNGTNQYASKASPAGITFTDDFTTEAWVRLESYPSGNNGNIISRVNSNVAGWTMRVNIDGTVSIIGYRTSGNNRLGTSHQSLPLGRWVHVAATLDMSDNTATIYIDGVSVPLTMTTAGTATTLVQDGDLYIGGISGNLDGKISDTRVWSTIRTGDQIRDNMNQQLTGSETDLVGYWKLNGDFDDSSSNANHLTPSGGAVATDVDNPFNDVEHAIITKVAYAGSTTTLTVQTSSDGVIPNMALNSPFYSTQKVPFGFPVSRGKWRVVSMGFTEVDQASPTSGVWYNIGSAQLKVPAGVWNVGFVHTLAAVRGSSGNSPIFAALSDANNTSSYPNLKVYSATISASTLTNLTNADTLAINDELELDVQTTLYLNAMVNTSSASQLSSFGMFGQRLIFAECAYV